MPGDFDFLSDEPRPAPKTKRAHEAKPIVERLDADPPRGKSVDDFDDSFAATPQSRKPNVREHNDRLPGGKKKPGALLYAAIAGGALLVIGAAVTLVLVVRGKDPEAKEKDKGTPPAPVVTLPAPAKKEPIDPNSPTPEVVEKVKKATLRVLVRYKNGKTASGSGFVEKNSGLVVTNAHVVGYLDAKDSPADAINLVVNSGLGDKEYRLAGDEKDIEVDAENDLALIRPQLLEIGERHVVPDGLVVARNPQLAELQSLFVFGFPLGTQIGPEVSVRPTKITSLRRDKGDGKLHLIQVEGGMTYGNSGGPVVDVEGNVVGVAVSGIKTETINFAVPSEKLLELLARRRK